MLHIRATPSADETLGTSHHALVVVRELDVATSGVVQVRLVAVNQVPVAGTQFVALRLQG